VRPWNNHRAILRQAARSRFLHLRRLRLSCPKEEVIMRRLFLALGTLLLLSACASPPGKTGDPAEVIAAAEAWGTAFNTHDAKVIAAMYAPDATLWGTNLKSVATTPAAVAEYFKDVAARPNVRVKFDTHNVRMLGDVATDAGNYTFSDGAAFNTTNRYSLVFARRDGKWVLVQHHSSRMP
jgi:uncharacterized protein (TIGR02246 family)